MSVQDPEEYTDEELAAAVLILGAIIVVLVTVRHLIRGEKYVSI